MPAYYTSTYAPPSPYPNNNANSTTTTSSPGGSTVMTIANPPLLTASHGMTPMEQNMIKPTSAGTMIVKRNQVKNACSKYIITTTTTTTKKMGKFLLMTTLNFFL